MPRRKEFLQPVKKLFFFFFLVSSQFAFTQEVNREVLALWNSENGKLSRDYANTNIHRKLEFVFNHYGLKLRFHDLSSGLPTFSTAKMLGVVTWFNREGMKNPEAYAKFLSKELSEGKKLLIIGEAGFNQDENGKNVNMARVNQTLLPMGIEFTDRFFDNPLLFDIGKTKGSEFVEFERSLEHEIFAFRKTMNRDPKNEVWLGMKVEGERETADVVIVGPRGGYVQDNFALFNNPQDGRSNWRINPFKLVEAIFVSPELPIPDTTTINGKRIFFSHIDGDGFLNVSEVDRQKFSSEIIHDQILKKYPLPVTASVITLDIDPRGGIAKDRRPQEIAKKIFALPNVEIGSHTYSHPLSWELNPSRAEQESYLGKSTTHTGPILSYKLPNLRLDYAAETVGSLAYINQSLAPSGKRGEILLWSGSCRPPEGALGPLAKHELLNINGGDSRMDSYFNSHSHLSSLYRMAGPYYQVYSGNANENVYTNLWSPPYSGFKDVVQTFMRTESPRRLKPANIYYHYYSGEHLASLKSLHIAYDWAMKEDLHPIFASDYARIVRGFVSAEITRLGDRRFRVSELGTLRTFRFKNPKLFPDYEKSVNVLGHVVFQDELYVHLGDAPEAVIELTEDASKIPHLISSNAQVIGVAKDASGVSYKLKGHLPVKASFWDGKNLRSYTSTGKMTEIKVGGP